MLKLNKSMKPIFLHSHQQTEFPVTELTRLHRSFFVSLWWDCIWHSWFHVHVFIGNVTVDAAEQKKHSLVKKVSKAIQTKTQHQANLLSNCLTNDQLIENPWVCEKNEEMPVQKERFVGTVNGISQSLEFGSGEQTKLLTWILFMQISFSIN